MVIELHNWVTSFMRLSTVPIKINVQVEGEIFLWILMSYKKRLYEDSYRRAVLTSYDAVQMDRVPNSGLCY